MQLLEYRVLVTLLFTFYTVIVCRRQKAPPKGTALIAVRKIYETRNERKARLIL